MWLFNSSIGKKFIMALSGAVLVLFVTFHVLMNAVCILWPVAYNKICMFLGANWYALIASIGLGTIVVIHIIYALILTIQNRKARGNDRYAINAKPKSVEWSSQNMLVLGIVIVAFLGMHLVQFWARMQAQEVVGGMYTVDGVQLPPQAGTLFIQLAFQNWWTPVIYIVGFVALWFHMNHGFWSMWQTVGWNNNTWIPRLKNIASWWVSVVIALFVAQAVVFTIQADKKTYLTDPALLNQYTEMLQEHFEESIEPMTTELQEIQREYQQLQSTGKMLENSERIAQIETRFGELQGKVQAAYAEHLDNITRLRGLAAKSEMENSK